MAHRVALESDSPTATTAPVTLAAAEAPFADPFLMEFEDPEALKSAYSETPMTFEQALMTARLEAKMATQVCCASTPACVLSDPMSLAPGTRYARTVETPWSGPGRPQVRAPLACCWAYALSAVVPKGAGYVCRVRARMRCATWRSAATRSR